MWLSYLQLDRVCDIVPHNMDIQSPQFQRAEFLFDPGGKCDLSAIYVCMDNDERALSAALVMHQRLREYDPYPYRPLSFLSPALEIHRRLRGDRIPIGVRIAGDAGRAALLQGRMALKALTTCTPSDCWIEPADWICCSAAPTRLLPGRCTRTTCSNRKR